MRVYFVESVFTCNACALEWQQARTINATSGLEFLPETNCPVCDSNLLTVKAGI